MDQARPKLYQIPTHLRVEDRLTIWFFSFTLRQLAILLLGGVMADDLWHRLPAEPPVLGLLRWVVAGAIMAIFLALAFVTIQGRTLPTWALIWVRYTVQPRSYGWRQLPDATLGMRTAAPGGPATSQEDEEEE